MTFQKNMQYGVKWPFLIFKEEFRNLSIPAGVYKAKPKFKRVACLRHDFKGCADRIKGLKRKSRFTKHDFLNKKMHHVMFALAFKFHLEIHGLETLMGTHLICSE
jgi:hypothetical protein